MLRAAVLAQTGLSSGPFDELYAVCSLTGQSPARLVGRIEPRPSRFYEPQPGVR